jgi:hypothetical protein
MVVRSIGVTIRHPQSKWIARKHIPSSGWSSAEPVKCLDKLKFVRKAF